MKTKSVFLVILMTCFIMTGFAVKNSYAKKNACGKEMTAAEMAERALDLQEIQNVMGMHQILGSPGGDHDLELQKYWAQKTPGVSFAHNRGVYFGIDVIRKYYGSGKSLQNSPKTEQTGQAPMMQAGAGNISFRTLTTPIIYIAGDGKTAKAYWYTPGFQANMQNGEGNAIWTYEKYAIDFVKEDGEWRIWHFHVYNDWEIPMGADLAKYAIEQSKKTETRQAPPVRQEFASAYKDTVFGEPYSITKVPNQFKSPRPPEPYCTFSDTFSYAEE
jgi:hypothetical protein